jgi:hypothetical protein
MEALPAFVPLLGLPALAAIRLEWKVFQVMTSTDVDRDRARIYP